MSPSRLCIVGLVALTAPLAAGQADFVSADDLQQAGLVKFWQLQLPLERDQQLADVYLADEQLYVTTHDGYVYAIHADTGAVRWLRPITKSGYRVWRPCHADKRAIFVTPTTVLQLDRLTGDGIAKLDLPFAGGSPAVSDGMLFYMGGINGRFYAFDVLDQMEEWKAGTQGPVTATPRLYREWLFVGGHRGPVRSEGAVRVAKGNVQGTGVVGGPRAVRAVQHHGSEVRRKGLHVHRAPNQGVGRKRRQ